jgi:hypothetical protein
MITLGGTSEAGESCEQTNSQSMVMLDGTSEACESCEQTKS